MIMSNSSNLTPEPPSNPDCMIGIAITNTGKNNISEMGSMPAGESGVVADPF
jgi:hypothetical protein